MDVVFRNHVLTGKVIHLFAQVDGRPVGIASTAHADHDLGAVDKRDDDVHARLEGGVILAEPLDDTRLALRHDDDGFLDKNQNQNNDNYQGNL